MTWASTSIHKAASAMRHFLGYLGYEEQFLQSVPIRCPRHIPIIPALGLEEEAAIVQFLEGKDGMHRDKAILALCYYLGRRAIDIINMQLEQLDWINETITVRQSKTGQIVVLPLLPVIGNHLKGYLLTERPDSESRHVILRMFIPYQKLADSSAIYNILDRAFSHLGTPGGSRLGSRLLRHHVASKQATAPDFKILHGLLPLTHTLVWCFTS